MNPMNREAGEQGKQYKPDSYLTQTAVDILNCSTKSISIEDLCQLISEMAGFESNQQFLLQVLKMIERDGASVEVQRLIVKEIIYDIVGLLGLKFDLSNLEAIIVQPKDQGNNHLMWISVNGKWYVARPDNNPTGVLFDLSPKVGEKSITAAIMKRFGLAF